MTAKETEQITFEKEKILTMTRYQNRVDLLRVLLQADKAYAFEEVDGMIHTFLKGKVK